MEKLLTILKYICIRVCREMHSNIIYFISNIYY
nr:MAG TPA: hypothetical protein [Caudoviricetes sp.]